MAESGWMRHSLAIGLFEFRRSVRALWQGKARFAMLAFGGVVPPILVAGLVVLFADAIPEIGTVSIPDVIRGSFALFWLFAVFLIGQRVVSAHAHIKAESMMLTTVSPRTVAGGLVVAETLRIISYVGLYALVATGIAVFLLGSIPSLVFVPLTAVLFAATAVVVGSACGYAVAWLVATSRFVARHKTVLGGVAAVIFFGAYFVFQSTGIGGVSQSSLAWLPMAWFADLAAVGSPFVGSPFRAGGALVGSALVFVLGGAIIEREALAFWFTEPVDPDADSIDEPVPTANPSGSDALAAAIKPLVVPTVISAPTRRVAEWTLLRARREPNRLTFVLMPIIAIGGSMLGGSVGSLDVLAAPACAVVLAWLSGALFALNPLGDEGSVLPVTLTAVSGTQYVRGLVLPGVLFGLPVVVVATAIAGVVSPYTLAQRVGLVVLGGFLTCIAAGIAPAVGMALPRFSAISVGRSDDVLPPRISAVVVHLALVAVPGTALAMLVVVPRLARGVLSVLVGALPAFVFGLAANGGPFAAASGWFSGVGDAVRALGVVRIQAVAGGILLVVGMVVWYSLYRHAIHRFDRFSPL